MRTPGPSPYLSSDHAAVRAAAAAFAEREVRPHAAAWEAAGEFPRELYRLAAKAGLLGLRYPPELGGAGLDFLATCVACEELAKADSIGTAVGLMAQSEFSLAILVDEASAELKAEYVVPALRGERIGAIGVSEPGAGSDVAALRTRARRVGGDYVISGQKTFITNGTRADFISLAVRTGEEGARGISVLLFPTDTRGFSVSRKLDKLGSRASDTAELFFDECHVPVRNLVGEEGRGLRYILSHFGGERLVIAAFAVGAMERLLELGLAHASDRKVFGAPLAGYQTWRHRFAGMATRLETTRLLAYQAAYLLQRRDADAEVAVSMAKEHAAASVQAVAADVLQLHGGFGQMEESPVPRYFRDVAGFSVGAGTSEVMRELIARALF